MQFDKEFRADDVLVIPREEGLKVSHLERAAPGIVDFMFRHAGLSFNQGLYRIHPVAEMQKWTSTVIGAFPDFKGRAFCFSYDWLGRHFALDSQRRKGEQHIVLMLEPGTGQVLEIPATFELFHEVELIEYQNESLAVEFYRDWIDAGGTAPDMSQCIGYKRPLFLSGEDDVSNLELIDMDVYWSICGQVLAKTRNLPEGTRVDNLRIGQ